MPTRLKLMPDYGCFPLWHAGGDAVGNVDPDTLPLSSPTRDALARWAAAFDATLVDEDPAASGFATATDADAFVREGTRLHALLGAELGDAWEVVLVAPTGHVATTR